MGLAKKIQARGDSTRNKSGDSLKLKAAAEN
jgi:hypothetical protein